MDLACAGGTSIPATSLSAHRILEGYPKAFSERSVIAQPLSQELKDLLDRKTRPSVRANTFEC